MSMLDECSKGPWRVRSRIGGNEIRDADDLFVAAIDGPPATERLVAAAPEAYNALLAFVTHRPHFGETVALLRSIDPKLRPWPMRKEIRS